MNRLFEQKEWASWGLNTENSNLFDLADKGEVCSLELEVEHELLHSGGARRTLDQVPGNLWDTVTEGSIRGLGFEAILREPVPKDTLLQGLAQLIPVLSGVKDTFRAAVHFHCNAQYWSRERLARFAIAYYLLEPAIYEWAGQGRDESIFCVPWSQGCAHVHDLLEAYHARSPKRWRNALNGAPKYAGVNLSSLSKFGSVEFRHMPTPSGTPLEIIRKLAEFIEICTEVTRLPELADESLSLLEFAEWVVTRQGNRHTRLISSQSGTIVPTHLCRVYSVLAQAATVDPLTEGMSAPVVMNTVRTRHRQRRAPFPHVHTYLGEVDLERVELELSLDEGLEY
jgi:hypothetical protein